jgi:hypothetical protein
MPQLRGNEPTLGLNIFIGFQLKESFSRNKVFSAEICNFNGIRKNKRFPRFSVKTIIFRPKGEREFRRLETMKRHVILFHLTPNIINTLSTKPI